MSQLSTALFLPKMCKIFQLTSLCGELFHKIREKQFPKSFLEVQYVNIRKLELKCSFFYISFSEGVRVDGKMYLFCHEVRKLNKVFGS